MPLIKPTELRLFPAIAELGRQLINDRQESDSDTDPVQYYGAAFMDDMSIATYSEARPEGRRAVRALANIIRVNANDMKAAKRILGYERNDYYGFALAATILQSLGKWETASPALSLLLPPASVQVRGPFYPKQTELGLNTGSNWSFHCLLVGKRTPELETAVKALAGLFRVNQRDLHAIATRMVAEGTSAVELEAKLAEVVVASIRQCQRFVSAWNWVLPRS